MRIDIDAGNKYQTNNQTYWFTRQGRVLRFVQSPNVYWLIVLSRDSPLNPNQEHSNDVVVPCGGIIQNLFRENFRDEQQYLTNEFVLAVFESDENVAISYIQIATIISFYLSLICSQSASKQNIRNRYIFNRIRVSFSPILRSRPRYL